MQSTLSLATSRLGGSPDESRLASPFFSAVHTRRLCLTHIRGRNAIRTLTYITKSNLFTVAVALGCNGFWNCYLHAHLPAAGGPDCLPLGNLNARDFEMPACLGHAQRHCAAPHEGQGGVTLHGPRSCPQPGTALVFPTHRADGWRRRLRACAARGPDTATACQLHAVL